MSADPPLGGEGHSETPVFILGADRSGTTLLRSLLSERFSIAVPPESEFIRDLARWRVGPPPTEADVDHLLGEIERHPRYVSWKVSSPLRPERPATFASRADAYRSLVSRPFELYASEHDSLVWGDKTPSFLSDLSLLDEIWPRCRFVFIERDGRDVFCSVRSLPFGPNTPRAAARSWVEVIERRWSAEQEFGGRVLTVRYEALVRDPEPVLRKVSDFLALEARDEVPIESGRVVDARRAAWFPKLRGSVDTSSVHRWTCDLDARDLADFESVAARHLTVLGYERGAHARPRGSAGVTAQRAREVWLKGLHFVTLRLVRERGREVRYVLRRKWRSLR